MKINDQTTDLFLLKSYLEGNEKGLEFLIKKHQSQIYNFIRSKVLDKAISDDLFQDVFIKVIESLKTKTYNEQGKFLPWVMRIAHNIMMDHFRNLKKINIVRENENFNVFERNGSWDISMEQEIMIEDLNRNLIDLLQELLPEQKEILVMRFFYNRSFKEIAEDTGVSINTSLGRMRYAIVNLKKLIEKHQILLTVYKN
jgi:RNA polymerase sigma-70 factor (ECF subfamily)